MGPAVSLGEPRGDREQGGGMGQELGAAMHNAGDAARPTGSTATGKRGGDTGAGDPVGPRDPAKVTQQLS